MDARAHKIQDLDVNESKQSILKHFLEKHELRIDN